MLSFEAKSSSNVARGNSLRAFALSVTLTTIPAVSAAVGTEVGGGVGTEVGSGVG